MMRTETLEVKLFVLFVGIGVFLIMGMRSMPPEPLRLPFAYVVDEFDLNVIDVLTGDILYQATSSEYDCPESISPDGQWLLYFTSPNSPQNRNYVLIDLNTGNEIPLPHTQINFLGWQSDGFAYFHRPENQELGAIYHYDFKSAQAQPLVTASHPVYQGMWRQLTDRYVFITYSEDQITFHQESELDTSFSLPANQADGFSLSPEGEYVAFYGKDKFLDEYKDYVFDVRTGEYAITDDFRSWRPDSHELGYITADGNHIVIYNAATKEEKVVVSFRFLSSFRWSPKGRYIAYKTSYPGGTVNSSDSLHILDTLKGESTDVAGYISPDAGDMQWVSETILAYTAASVDLVQADSGWQPENADLWIYDVAVEQGKQLTETPNVNEGLHCMWG